MPVNDQKVTWDNKVALVATAYGQGFTDGVREGRAEMLAEVVEHLITFPEDGAADALKTKFGRL